MGFAAAKISPKVQGKDKAPKKHKGEEVTLKGAFKDAVIANK